MKSDYKCVDKKQTNKQTNKNNNNKKKKHTSAGEKNALQTHLLKLKK